MTDNLVPPAPVAPDAPVTLREVTAATLGPVLRLEVRPEQRGFVATNAVSIAQAHFSEQAWFRGIWAGDVPVGFVMLSLDRAKQEYWVWRFMIAAPYQRCGFGRAALRLVVEHVRRLPGAAELKLSYSPGEGGPQPFYRGLGFEDTGEIEDGEHVMRLALA